MSICSTGSSQPKAGVPSAVVVDTAYVQSLLPPALAWLFPYLPFMQGLVIGNVDDFCTADPPTFTMPSALEFLAFVTGGPLSSYLVVNQFLQDLTKAFLWSRLCECVSSGTHAEPTNPTDPGNLPAVNPPGYTAPPTTAPCGTITSATVRINDNAFHNVIGTQSGSGTLTAGVPIPVGATSVVVTIVNTLVSGSAGQLAVNQCLGSSAVVATNNFVSTPAANTTTTVTRAVAATERFVAVGAGRASVDTTVADVQVTLQFYCGGVPGQTQAPCCPPDPVLRGLLAQVLGLVTLVQRQAVPFAYVYGDNHADLTNDGELSVSGLIGVSVDVSVLPDSYGRAVGTPERLFDLGFVTLGTADGWEVTRRIDSDGTLVLPSSAGAFTRIGYSLSAGVEVAIRELVREP